MCVCGVHARIGGLFQHKNKLQNQIMKTTIRILAHRCTRSHLFASAFLIDFVPVVRSCGFAISTVFLLFSLFFLLNPVETASVFRLVPVGRQGLV